MFSSKFLGTALDPGLQNLFGSVYIVYLMFDGSKQNVVIRRSGSSPVKKFMGVIKFKIVPFLFGGVDYYTYLYRVKQLKLKVMEITFWVGFWIFIGAIFCPIFTLGCVVVSLGYTSFGIVLIVIGIIDFILDLTENKN